MVTFNCYFGHEDIFLCFTWVLMFGCYMKSCKFELTDDRKSSRDKTIIGHLNINRGCPPFTAKRNIRDHVENSPGPPTHQTYRDEAPLHLGLLRFTASAILVY